MKELEKFFAEAELPKAPFKLDSVTTITDMALFLSSHLATVKAHGESKGYKPYLERLIMFKNKIYKENKRAA